MIPGLQKGIKQSPTSAKQVKSKHFSRPRIGEVFPTLLETTHW